MPAACTHPQTEPTAVCRPAAAQTRFAPANAKALVVPPVDAPTTTLPAPSTAVVAAVAATAVPAAAAAVFAMHVHAQPLALHGYAAQPVRWTERATLLHRSPWCAACTPQQPAR